MLGVLFFLLYLAANFAWLIFIVGAPMAWMMPRTPNRNRIIITVVAALSLALTLAVAERGPGFGDEFGGECDTSRMGERCH